VELLRDHRSVDRAGRALDGLADGLDDDLFEDEARDVLRSVDLPDLRVSGHDHGGLAVDAGEPGSLGVGHTAVLVGERVLAEVPDRSVVALGVVVDGDLEDAPVEIGNELRLARLHVLAVPAD
jgi:hypothetical protein